MLGKPVLAVQVVPVVSVLTSIASVFAKKNADLSLAGVPDYSSGNDTVGELLC